MTRPARPKEHLPRPAGAACIPAAAPSRGRRRSGPRAFVLRSPTCSRSGDDGGLLERRLSATGRPVGPDTVPSVVAWPAPRNRGRCGGPSPAPGWRRRRSDNPSAFGRWRPRCGRCRTVRPPTRSRRAPHRQARERDQSGAQSRALTAGSRPGQELHDDRLGRREGCAPLEMMPKTHVRRVPGGTE